MYKELLEEIKERQKERLEHYKTNQPVDTECLQIDDIDALLCEIAVLMAENERLKKVCTLVIRNRYNPNRIIKEDIVTRARIALAAAKKVEEE